MLPVLSRADEVMLPGPKFFAYPDGSYYVVGMGLTDKNILDRQYFPVVMSGQNSHTELVVSRSTGEKVMVIAVPVKKGGEVVGLLGISIFLEDLSNIIADKIGLPNDMLFYAVKGADQVALHSDTALIMGERPETPKDSASVTAPFTGWQVTIGNKD